MVWQLASQVMNRVSLSGARRSVEDPDVARGASLDTPLSRGPVSLPSEKETLTLPSLSDLCNFQPDPVKKTVNFRRSSMLLLHS